MLRSRNEAFVGQASTQTRTERAVACSLTKACDAKTLESAAFGAPSSVLPLSPSALSSDCEEREPKLIKVRREKEVNFANEGLEHSALSS